MTTKRQGRDPGFLWLMNIQEPTLASIPREQLVQDPYQPRKKISPAKLRGLARSIKETGLQQRVIVNPGYVRDKIAYFYIDKGERRWRAHGIAKIDYVDCIVQPKHYNAEYDPSRDLAQAAENGCREGHTHKEYVLLVRRIVEATRVEYNGERGYLGIAYEKINIAFGESQGFAERYHRLGRLDDALIDMLDEEDDTRRLSIPDALALSKAPTETQCTILEKGNDVRKKHGGIAARKFVSTEARRILVDQGHKVRGRHPSDDKDDLGRLLRIVAVKVDAFVGDRHSGEYRAFIERLVGNLGTIDVDEMLNIGHALVELEHIHTLLKARRAALYAPLSVVGAKKR